AVARIGGACRAGTSPRAGPPAGAGGPAATRDIRAAARAGLPADHSAFARLAARTGVAVIEDAACAIGSRVAGRPVGADAEVAVFSFHPRKLLTTGEGGMIVTRDGVLAERIRSLRHHGVSVSDYQ